MTSILIPITALMIPIVIVPTSLWFRHRSKVRELEHAERIRAMELGIMPRQAELGWPGALVCVGIGAGVPVGLMLIAWLAVLTADVDAQIFSVPLVVSFPAIFTAKKLADRMLNSSSVAEAGLVNRLYETRATAKPAFDPDAYDVVGRRG